MKKENEIIDLSNKSNVEINSSTIGSLIHIIRGKQVILDQDLAMLYQVETGALNRAVKRNQKRFPDDFCFQLTEEEFLRCQTGISKEETDENRGGRRYLPYVFTEQGISMLSAILHSDVAVNVSIGIMRAFVEMRKFLANNSLLLNRMNEFEVKLLEYEKNTDERFDKIFQYIDDHTESEQKIFFDGQVYDAFSLIISIDSMICVVEVLWRLFISVRGATRGIVRSICAWRRSCSLLR